VIEFLRLFS